MSEFEVLTLKCQDDYVLNARFYAAKALKKHTLPILLCPATGITAKFYHSFCTWLATQGYDILSFDFRGIGESLHGHVKDSKASIVQWGQLDIPAAIDALLAKTQAAQLILLGHSAGGQLLGIAPNYAKVAKVVAIAGSTGNLRGLKGRTKLLAPVMFHAIFPIARLSLGYGPTQAIGMGENLPKDVAREWAQFCSKPGYVMNAIGKQIDPSQDYHHNIQCPITSIWATDDEIASEANVKDLMRLYPNATTKIVALNPKHYGHKAIGHMLMFKHSHQNLWPVIANELSIANDI